MENRTIKNILYAQPFNMGGFPVRQPIPSANVEQVDPFLLLHHAEAKFSPNRPVNKSGVGPHPHRGFSPVTFIFKGGVHHRDSRGNDNVVYAGGTQWMNAGMGIVHSERPPEDVFEKGGLQEIIQLWINTPSSHKMDQPKYFPLPADETPSFTTPDSLGAIKIVSGKLENIEGPIPSLSPVNTFTADFKKGARYFFSIPSTHNLFIYLLDGKLKLNDLEEVQGKYAVVFNNVGEGFEAEALEDSRFLIASGEPLNETVASNGPFVMNNETELLYAFRDYEMGKMGVLIED